MRRYHTVLIRLFTCLAILAVVPGGAGLQAQHPSPIRGGEGAPSVAEQGGARLIRSDDQAVVFEVTVPPLTVRPVTLNGATYQELSIPGYGLAGEPGVPALPARGWTLGVPPGAEIALSVLEAESVEQSLGRVRPVQTIHYQPSFTGDLPDYTTEVVANPDVYARDAFIPDAPVTVGAPSWLRDQRIVAVSVQPVQYNPARGQARVYSRFVIQLRFTYPEGRPALQPRPESAAYERLIQATLLNYESARAWRTRAEGPAAPALPSCTQWSGFNSASVRKIAVNQDGIYQLTYDALQAAGVPVGSINPRTFKLCDAGAEVAIYEQGDGDATFEPGEKLVFYGRKSTTRYTDTNTYWLVWGGANGQRMQVIDGTPILSPRPYYTDTIHLEENHLYFSYIPPAGNATHDHWFWNLLYYGYDPSLYPPTRTYTITLSNLAPGLSYTPMLRLSLWTGASNWQARANIKFNDQPSAGWTYTWTGELNVQLPLDPAWLAEGANVVQVVALSSGTSIYTIAADWFELTYRRNFVAQNDRLTFGYPGGGPWRYQISGFSSSNVAAFDITNPAQPRYISPPSLIAPCALLGETRQREEQQDVNFDFQPPTTSPATYTVQTAGQCLAPASITTDTPSSLYSTTNRADYIVIAPAALSGGTLTPLVNLRQSQGKTPMVVDLQDVYDEFGDGELHPQAIHDFLWYAYQNWTAPAPQYVLLIGDGHYDFKNYLGTNAPNPMPPYLVNVDAYEGEAPADNRYVSNPQSYTQPGLPFMSIGRAPVNNTTELTVLVNKIVNYESNPPSGAWRQQMAFVTDNGLGVGGPPCQPDPAGNFYESSDGIINQNVLSWKPQQPVDRIYYDPEDCYEPGGTPQYTTTLQVRTAITTEINAGRSFVNYYGHAGVQYWAAEQLFNLTIVNSLVNGDRLPIMLPMTCLAGYFVMPYSNTQSLDEVMIRRQGGGSLAAYTPTGLQVDTAHTYLNAGFYDRLFRDNLREVGLLADAGKQRLWDCSSCIFYRDLIDTYMLMGDPAMQVQIMNQWLDLPLVVR